MLSMFIRWMEHKFDLHVKGERLNEGGGRFYTNAPRFYRTEPSRKTPLSDISDEYGILPALLQIYHLSRPMPTEG